MIEIYVFDWSGVISDDTKPVYESNMMLLADHGHERISFEEWRRRSALTPAGFLRNCGIECDEQDTFERYKQYFNALMNDGYKPEIIQGSFQALDKLNDKGKRLIVLSSHITGNLIREMEEYGVGRFFNRVIGNVSNKVSGLIAICNGLEVNEDAVLYTGDTIYDIQSGKEAGVKTGAVFSGYHDRTRLVAENPDYKSGNLLGIVKQIEDEEESVLFCRK